MKFMSWNVNGIKSCSRQNLEKILINSNPDFLCLQETKLSKSQEISKEFEFKNYKNYFNHSNKSGYSGTAIFTKHEPINILNNNNNNIYNGRVIILEYHNFYLINIYIPCSKNSFLKEDFREEWDIYFREHMKKLNNIKPVIICGDFNATNLNIDRKSNNNSGLTEENTANFHELLEYVNLKDTYRILHPNEQNKFTWWSYSRNKRNENSGARLDYFLISNILCKNLQQADIHTDILGSDHCPISIILSI